eukprot:PhF_6_TR35006/c0_g4_i1/m.50926/K16749/BBS7; Bardet-Biedl syndrome 7 protein
MFGPSDVSMQRDHLLSTASTNLGCLRVVPLGKKSRQKMVVGDSTGIVHCFSVDKHHEISMTYESAPLGKPITRVQLMEDKAFVSSGEKITGFSKKGRDFLTMETNLSELITSIQVRHPKIWTAGSYILTQFDDGKEVCFSMIPDRILDILVDSVLGNDAAFECFLACQDRMVRVVRGPEIAVEFPVEGPASCLAKFPSADGSREIMYGTMNGVLSGFRVTSAGPVRRYCVENNRRAGAIVALHSLDFLKDGLGTIVAARDDGVLDVFSMNQNAVPTLVHSEPLQETVTGIDGGFIVSTQQTDIVCNTYSGKVIALINAYDEAKAAEAPVIRTSTTSGALQSNAPTQDFMSKRDEAQKRIAALRSEIEETRRKVETKKADYSKSVSNEFVAVAPAFTVRDKWSLDTSGSWLLSLELNTPVECVVVQSDVDLELLETDLPAILSTTPPDPTSMKNTKLLAMYRLSETSHRFQLRVRALEGQLGTLRVFVIPTTQPKTAQLRTYTIKPLSLHHRLTEIPPLNVPMNVLKLTGTFTVNDMHAWVSIVLPEVPEAIQGDEVNLSFVSTFQQTILTCVYRKGEATFSSNNLTSLCILKEVATREATQRKIQIKISFDFKPESCQNVLDLLHEKMFYQHSLMERVRLIQALQEIEMQEQDVSFLSKEYLDTLKNAKELEKESKLQPKRLEYLQSIVRRLMTDVFSLKGESAHSKMSALNQYLEHYNLAQLKEFFKHF